MVLESNRDLVLRRLMECLSRDRTKHQVAEVTSLGLVQMTRKKLGIGLLEAFSEPCEACAARGVIVHHEPVMRSKFTGNDDGAPKQQQGNKNRNRGKDRNRQIEVAKVVTPESASQLNSVIGKIAASTLAAHEAAGEPSLIVLPTGAIGGNKPAGKSSTSDDAANTAPNAEKLLESVLDALPEPKAAGQGRKKSRRVSTGGNITPGAGSAE
jgi:ribonuclease E